MAKPGRAKSSKQTLSDAKKLASLTVEGGKIAYWDYGGRGDCVILLPGAGETKGSYRFLAPLLAKAGYRVIAMDIRGHGDSSASFTDYSIEAMGQDTLALIDRIGNKPVHLVGNSKAASTIVWVALKKPKLVKSLVLIGPFVRKIPMPFWMTAGAKLVTLTPGLWDMYYKTLYKDNPPADLAGYRAKLKQNWSEHGRMKALRETLFTYSQEVSDNLSQIKSKVLIVMGSKDPDFREPLKEAEFLAKQTGGEIFIVEGAGHYPQAEYPDQTAQALIKFFG